MADRLRARSSDDRIGLNDPAVIGTGRDATILRAPLERTVRKRYANSDLLKRVELAQDEFIALQRARTMLDSIPSVTCPRPLDVIEATGELLMEYCPGEQLDEVIGSDRFAESTELAYIASQLAAAMSVLTSELEIEQLDFSLRNTMITGNHSEIVLVDFTRRPMLIGAPEGWRNIEVALASFVTSAITYQVRHSTLLRVTEGVRLRWLAREMSDRLRNSHDLDMVRVRRLAWLHFWRQANNRGWKRYLWFHTVGAAVFASLLWRTVR